MHFKLTFRQSFLKRGFNGLCFLKCLAVNEPVVCVSAPRKLRVFPLHPVIEHIVQNTSVRLSDGCLPIAF